MSENEKKPMSIKTKLIIAGVILLILAVLAMIYIPRYNQAMRNKSAAEGKAALEALRQSVENTWKSSGSISGITLESALEAAGIEQKIKNEWQFAIAWKATEIYTAEMVNNLQNVSTNQVVHVSPYKIIMAVAKAGNRLPEGTKIWFAGDANQYHGYGIDAEIEPDWSSIFPNP